MKRTQKATDARKPKLIFKCKEYVIERIPLNFRITISKAMEPKRPSAGIDRDYYSSPEKGLDEAHAVAKKCISDHYQPRSRTQIGRPFTSQVR